MTAFYNEIDPACGAVLNELISTGVIAPGIVESRSIKEVNPDDIRSYTQAHFFAGGGLWSVAARLAGWPDDKPLWTASCPCQPFSQAGKQRGTADERHLWPDLFRLVRAVRPRIVVGEQVSGAAGYAWLDGVRADLASEGYTCRAFDIPACAVDAPHIRNRLYWIAVAEPDVIGGRTGTGRADGTQVGDAHGPHTMVDAARIGWREGQPQPELRSWRHAAAVADAPGDMGDALDARLERQPRHGNAAGRRQVEAGSVAAPDGGYMADADHDGQPPREWDDQAARHGNPAGAAHGGDGQSFWSDAEWITCHDGKARRTKSRLCDVADGVSRSLGGGSDFGALTPEEKEAVTKVLSPDLLVDALPSRVDLWRIAGNAIVPQIAAEVLKALMETS